MTLILGLLYDVFFGDPPNRLHPVAWMGTCIGVARRLAPTGGRALPCLYGAMVVCGGAFAVWEIGTVVVGVLRTLPLPVSWVLEACLLKTTFALRGLAQAATQVQVALAEGDVERARHLVAWHLVSRDTSQLTSSQVAAATVESVAENASDSLIAPLLYYVLGGLPAALAYRFINTADAMLGYRDAEREWLGKVPARLDDLVNLLPARLTALLLLLVTYLLGGPAWRTWLVWRRDARQTASPNAGCPMSAMAGALGIELEKVGHYCLGAGQGLPGAHDITSAVRLVYGVAAMAVGLGVLAEWVQWLL